MEAGAVSAGIQGNSAPVEGGRPAIKRGSRFTLYSRLDGRWSIVDTEAGYRVVVFCPDLTEAKLILAALNIELPRRAKRTSTPGHS
jgi:hypothetical protein